MSKLRLFLVMLVVAGFVFFACSNDSKEPDNGNGNGYGNANSSSSANTFGVSSSSYVPIVIPPEDPIDPNAGGVTGGCIDPPGYGVPPNGVETCITVGGKCYMCNPDRGSQCLMEWLWTGGQVDQEWWFSKISCDEVSSGNTPNTPVLTCEGLAKTGITGSTIIQPTVKCDGTALSSGFSFTGAPNSWTSPAQDTYNVKANATSGNCKDQTADCGSIVVKTPEANELTCTGLQTPIIAGTNISNARPTVKCGTSSASGVTWNSTSPTLDWNNPTANTYTVKATATCDNQSKTVDCGTLKVNPKLACGNITTSSVIAGTAVTPPTVTCGSTTVTSITWTNAPELWSNPTANGGSAKAYSNIKAKANAGTGDCSGQEAACSGTLTVNPKLTCGDVGQNILTTKVPDKPSLKCGTVDVVNNTVTWTPNINNALSAGSYSNIKAKVTSGTCKDQEATCAGTITVTAAPSSSSRASSSSVSTGGSSNPYQPLVRGASGVKEGWASRYWDGCKPSCAWTNNVPDRNPTKSCSNNGTTQLSKDAVNYCADGGSAHTCYSQTPFVEGSVAYAFAASHSNGDCGKCFQVQFDGGVTNNPQSSSPAATLSYINGKTLIVKISNIGGDVSGTQFDLMIPGGGLGYYDGFSMQDGVNGSKLGARYGGLTADCISEKGNNATIDTYKTCLKDKCDAAFTNSDLKAGCKIYADWFGVANNPTFITKEITCPSQLNNKW